jgi:hypothetical protein
MTKLFPAMLLAALLVSCDMHKDFDIPLDPDQFYAINFSNNTFYKVRAKVLATGDRCVIWAENGSDVTEAQAKNIANEYDNKIRPQIVDAFGMKDIVGGGDILDYANRLSGKNDGKLTILLLDIKDDYKNKDTDPYVAGYFYSGNFYAKNTQFSNGCDMIYVDTYPGLKLREKETYATFAHELQHLINYATAQKIGRGPMDTWIDEGLSSQAEHIYVGDNIKRDKVIRFNEAGTIARGNNFFVWDNHKEDKMAILDEYATVYLFFRWLYLHANPELKTTIFRDIETSGLSDHTVITNVAQKIRPEWVNWETLLRSWLAANYNPADAVYGYNDSDFSNGTNKIMVKTITEKTIKLYPGEGVYSKINGSFTPPPPSGNIRYEELVKGADKALLTFNANTNNKSTAEPGSLTGVSASVSPMAIDAKQTETYTGPYVIDARDYNYAGILGRNK